MVMDVRVLRVKQVVMVSAILVQVVRGIAVEPLRPPRLPVRVGVVGLVVLGAWMRRLVLPRVVRPEIRPMGPVQARESCVAVAAALLRAPASVSRAAVLADSAESV